MRANTTTLTVAQPSSIYDLNTYPLPDGDSTVGITSYPRSQYHHVKRRQSEHTNSLPPQHPARQLQQYHHGHHQQQQRHHQPKYHRVNGGESERERFRRVSSPDGPAQGRVPAAYPGLRSTHSYNKLNPTAERHGRRGRGENGHVQRSASENNSRRPGNIVLNEKNGGYRGQSLSAQPKSDSLLQYNSLDRGLIYQREGSPSGSVARQRTAHPLSPSGPEMRAVLFEEVDFTDLAAADVRDPSRTQENPLTGEHYHYSSEDSQRYVCTRDLICQLLL